jgi:hypothetical protein
LVRVPYESRHKVGVDSQGHHLDIKKNLVRLALYGISHFSVEVGRSVNNVYSAMGSDIKTVSQAPGKSASLPVYYTGDLSGSQIRPCLFKRTKLIVPHQVDKVFFLPKYSQTQIL